MPNSKEYAYQIINKWVETNTEQAISVQVPIMLNQLYNDYEEISRTRKLISDKGISYAGILNALREIDLKWKSVVYHVHKEIDGFPLDEKSWQSYVKDKMPGLYPNFINSLNNTFKK